MIYRTLLIVDTDLVTKSSYSISYFATALRDGKSNQGRQELEKGLAEAAEVENGEVLVYCPSPDMQSKEVDVRLEIVEDRILPLRVQRESFAYQADVKVLEQYYQELWRMYIFVSPEVFSNPIKCKAIVDKFCEKYKVEKGLAYKKVRRYDFNVDHDEMIGKTLEPLHRFLDNKKGHGLPFRDVPPQIIADLLDEASTDTLYLKHVKSNSDPSARISSMFDRVVLNDLLNSGRVKSEKASIKKYIDELDSGKKHSVLRSREQVIETFAQYEELLLETVRHSME